MAVAWARPAVWCWAGIVLLPLGYSPPEKPRYVPLPRSFRATIPDVPLGVLVLVPGGVGLLETGLDPLPPPQPAKRVVRNKTSGVLDIDCSFIASYKPVLFESLSL